MGDRRQRLKKLVEVQAQLKALHEARHAGFLARAVAAEAEAAEFSRRFDEPDSLSVLFPELYHRSIANALARRDAELARAREEASLVAKATARTNMVERAWREADRQEERRRGDRERLDLIEQKRNAG
ncbi:hypothetical protein [Mesorhizobium sp. SP-1A]|uniref:hypothetical protein n=1 Tax=Mesorhizobium sp. SP-1A TaxID=3077840 RepID=UPI0028F7032C|nr:hypothetical protein [Mesorhizobium sp. SP-1A]